MNSNFFNNNQNQSDDDPNPKPKNTHLTKHPDVQNKEPIVDKEMKAIGQGVLDEGKNIGNAIQDVLLGTGRAEEINTIRKRKVGRSKEIQLEY